MEKHLEIFCKQNPTMDIECGNEECKYKTKIKTKDFLNTKYTYKYHCKKYGHDTIFDTKNLHKTLESLKEFC